MSLRRIARLLILIPLILHAVVAAADVENISINNSLPSTGEAQKTTIWIVQIAEYINIAIVAIGIMLWLTAQLGFTFWEMGSRNAHYLVLGGLVAYALVTYNMHYVVENGICGAPRQIALLWLLLKLIMKC